MLVLAGAGREATGDGGFEALVAERTTAKVTAYPTTRQGRPRPSTEDIPPRMSTCLWTVPADGRGGSAFVRLPV